MLAQAALEESTPSPRLDEEAKANEEGEAVWEDFLTQSESARANQRLEAIPRILLDARIEVSAEFGHALVSVREIARWRTDKVVPLNAEIGAPIGIWARGTKLGEGRVMQAREGNLAVLLERWFEVRA